MADKRFTPPWTVEQIPGGYKVKDANGQSLTYSESVSVAAFEAFTTR